MADDKLSKYSIRIGAYGDIEVEAPSKDECIALYEAVTATKKRSNLDEAIR